MQSFMNMIIGSNSIIKRNNQNIQMNDLESSVHSIDSVSSIHEREENRDNLDMKSFNPRKVLNHRLEPYDEVGYHLSQHSYHNSTQIQIYSEYQASIIELQNNNNERKSTDSIINSSPNSPRSPRGIVVTASQDDLNSLNSLNSSGSNSNQKIIKDRQNGNINAELEHNDTSKFVSIDEYFTKILASNNKSKALVNHLPTSWTQVIDAIISFIFAFIGIIILGLLDSYYTNTFAYGGVECIILIGAFGASAVLVFDCPESPLAQPRNVIGGFLVSSVIGVLISNVNIVLWLKAALAVSLSIMVMRLLSVVHPPGGAAALIVTTTPLSTLKFHYVGLVVGGAVIFVLLGIILNNLVKKRRYPLSY